MKLKRNQIWGALAMSILFVAQAGMASAGETKLKKTQLPAAVQKAADELAKDSQIVGYAKETENGKTFYEVETKKGSLTKDVQFDEQGNTVSVEQEVALTSLPPAVQEGLKKAAGKGKITKVETITKGSTVTYEAAVKGGPKKEILVDGNGAPVKD
jgi:uncharacterized membrane protein YkoI